MLVYFPDPDAAYLADAAIRRYADATIVPGCVIVPTDDGPALDLTQAASSDRVLRAVLRRFGGYPLDGDGREEPAR